MKALIIITTNFSEDSGIANAFMNYYRNLEFENLIIDIASCGDCGKTLLNEIYDHGSKYYALPSKQKNVLRYIYAVNQVLKENYDILDVHGNSATMALEMFLAKKNRISRRMAHCLNCKTNYPFIHSILKPYFNKICNIKTACTREAGSFLYGDREYIILKNTVETEKYRYSPSYRIQIRDMYHISNDEILFGTVGKMNIQKNQKFIVQVFSLLSKKIKNSRLMIVGDGPLRSDIEHLICTLHISDKVILTGMITDVVPYYSAFDIYLFPSLFEGLSLALLEAKCSGLYGIASLNIKSKDEDSTEFIKYDELKEEVWCSDIEHICRNMKDSDREKSSEIAIQKIKSDGYDSKNNSILLRKLYLGC